VNRVVFRAMGCEIVVGGASADALRRIRERFADANDQFTRFAATSELSRVNAADADVIRVSDSFAEMLAASLTAAERTGGLVDPTIGASLIAAGYDRDFGSLTGAESTTVSAPPPASYRDVSLRGSLVFRPRGVVFDLNGVVKGRTVDAAVALLDTPGFVSAGGDLATTTPITVGVPGGASVMLVRGAIATSSTTNRQWRRRGKQLHHLIDPSTGQPAASPWQHVTVCAATCFEADVLAKAALVAAVDGPAFLERRALAGRFVDATGAPHETRAWQRMTRDEQRVAACA
jgi:FAD:protein FMN transferase